MPHQDPHYNGPEITVLGFGFRPKGAHRILSDSTMLAASLFDKNLVTYAPKQ